MIQFLRPSPDEIDDLDVIALTQCAPIELLTVEDLQVDLDSYTVRADLQLAQQVRHGATSTHATRLSIDLDLHSSYHFASCTDVFGVAPSSPQQKTREYPTGRQKWLSTKGGTPARAPHEEVVHRAVACKPIRTARHCAR